MARLPLSGADAADRDFNRRILLRRLELLALAYAEAGRLEAGFDVAAVLVNAAPDYAPGRTALASVYRALGLAAAASALEPAEPPWGRAGAP